MVVLKCISKTDDQIYLSHHFFRYEHIAESSIKVLFVLIVIPMFAVLACVQSAEAQNAREYINLTCSEALAKLASAEQANDIQKKDVFQSYNGKWVKWAGTIDLVSETLWGVELTIKCRQDSREGDATISFEDSWKAQLLKLTKGQQIQFAGQIADYEKAGGFSIKGGELVNKEERKSPSNPPIAQPPVPDNNPSPPISDAHQVAQSPSLSVGDEFVVEHKNLTNPKLSYIGERKIVSLDGNRVRITVRNLNSSYVRTLDYDRQWNVIASRGNAGEGFDYSPPIKYYDFPLFPGKRWSLNSTERNIKTGQVREHTITAEVGGWEMVTVPAGTFRAIKVIVHSEVKDPQTGQIISGNDISWYAPVAKRSVKSELTSFNTREGQDDVQIAELIRYSVK